MQTAPAIVLDASLALVRDRKVGGNAHESMLKNRYISASRLVKSTAKDLIAEILADLPADPEGAHWGEDGNAKAAINLANVRCQEPSLNVPLPGAGDAWPITGHPDGLDLRSAGGIAWSWTGFSTQPHFATVFENKAPMFDPGVDQVELYYRQGLLYLAMLLDMRKRNDGAGILQPAGWLAEDDPRNRPWALPNVILPAQVVVCIQPGMEPKREHAFPVDEETCAAHLARYVEKARVVAAGVMAGDPSRGEREWDSVKGKGLGEFDIKGKPVVLDGAGAVAAVEAERVAAAAKKAAEEQHEAAKAVLEQHLKAQGLEEAAVGGYRVVLQRAKGGIRHFIVEDSVSLRVYGGPKKTKEVAA